MLLSKSPWERWRGTGRRICLATWSIAIFPWGSGSQAPALYVADVGHGTAAILHLPGAQTWLFDAGSRDRPGVARGALAPLLRWLDVSRLQVALSHGDSDHAGALPWLQERFPPVTWMGALPAQWMERLPHDCQVLDLQGGRLELGTEETGLTLIRGLDESGNEGSRSLEIRSGGQKWLLCGDAEGDGLARQLRAGSIRGPYDLVLFPHHGSETPWLEEFLAAALPREVWFSAATRPVVADELDRRGIPWRCTARDGPLHWPN
ncbi:MAG: beta-lactamase superfamily II metal-dependent hydrolase [Candidatus Paceibacteria bacterium]